MTEPIISIDISRVHEGKLEQLKEAMKDLAAFVLAEEPRAIAYQVFLDEEEGTVTVLQIHPDAGSMELHMDVAGPRFRPFADLLTLSRIDVYGVPSARLLGQLRQKARMLGNAPLAVHRLHAGFARLVGSAGQPYRG